MKNAITSRNTARCAFAIVVCLGAFALSACSDSSEPKAGTPATSTGTPAAEQPEVIDYTHGDPYGGLPVKTVSGAKNLFGAPKDFQEFIAAEFGKLEKDDDGSCESGIQITVDKVHKDGFASGAITSCGGYAAFWAKPDGKWKEALGTQELPDCKRLNEFGFPLSIAGDKCSNEKGEHVPYTP